MTRDSDRGPIDILFSRPLAVADVPENGLEISIDATAEERAALAKALGLLGLSRLEADLRIDRDGGGELKVAGQLRADVRQRCVVTLDEFDARVVEPIAVRFASRSPAPARGRGGRTRNGKRSADVETVRQRVSHYVGLADDPPDPLIGDSIDLGALAAEFLALGVDPYPRKPGVTFGELQPAREIEAASPFGVLRTAAKKS
ncbi:MAG: DUF177 domain-containing protein [Methylocystis sp.]|nr:DUF177 domain-containing protein [Methylocystis sp.]MBI3275965.1 DUF177 domain-containing protein [Methylocystis sp.]